MPHWQNGFVHALQTCMSLVQMLHSIVNNSTFVLLRHYDLEMSTLLEVIHTNIH